MKLLKIALAVLTVSLYAEELDVNGTFKPGANGVPEGYRLITDKARVGTAVMQGQTVKLTSEQGVIALVFDRKFKVVPGEKYVLEAQFEGKGFAGVGLQYFDAQNNYLRGDYARMADCGKTNRVRREITIPAQEGRKRKAAPAQVNFLICVSNKGEAVFRSFKVDKVE